MQKEARELRDFIHRRVLDKYPLVTCNFEETRGHHVKITLGAPNGRNETLFCTAGGDPLTRLNVERDVKGALRKLNIALQGEDRTMASISTKSQNGKKVVHSFRDIKHAKDLNEEVDTAPKEAKLQVNGNVFHAAPSHISPKTGRREWDMTEAERLFAEGKTHRQVHEATGIPLGTLSTKLKRKKGTKVFQFDPPTADTAVPPPRKPRAPVRRKTQANVFKIAMHLSVRCQLDGDFAVYEDDWSDSRIATIVGNGCEADDVKELRIKNIGKLLSEIPKSQLEPDLRAMLKRIQKLEGEMSLLKGLSERVQLLEDAVTKP